MNMQPDFPLALYENARSALAQLTRIDQVKDIHDKALAMKIYAQQAQDNEMVAMASEVRLRAEIRAGELLHDMAERGERETRGGDRKSKLPEGTLNGPTLAELGVTKKQSHKWQKLAALPKAEQEALIAGIKSPKKKAPSGRQMTAGKAFVQAYEADAGKLPSEDEIAEGAGVARSTAHTIAVAFKSRRDEDFNPVKFTKAQDHHVAARIKIATKALEADFNERVRLAMLERNAEYREGLERLEKEALERRELAEAMFNNYRPIFTETEFSDIRFCLHPDNSASTEKRVHAFKTFNLMKLQLTGKK